MKIRITEIHKTAAERPEGYAEHVISEGEIVGDYLEISSESLAKLRAIYRPAKPALKGLGDVVAAVAQPIAKVIDAVAGTNVAGCGGCAKRQAALNAVVPFK